MQSTYTHTHIYICMICTYICNVCTYRMHCRPYSAKRADGRRRTSPGTSRAVAELLGSAGAGTGTPFLGSRSEGEARAMLRLLVPSIDSRSYKSPMFLVYVYIYIYYIASYISDIAQYTDNGNDLGQTPWKREGLRRSIW